MYSNKNGEMGIYIISMIDGKFVKRIISGNKTSEFEELHILKPGISWSSDGNKIVFAAKSGKSDALFIFDLNDSSKNLKKVFNLEGIFRPTWNPINNKIAFVYFNITLIILITTWVVDVNSNYIYIIPLCIMPLLFKAFFDSRIAFFIHSVTVMLLGFVVPNSYEFIFLNIIAGVVTILTSDNIYKRANLFIAVAQITFVYMLAYFSFYVIQEGNIENLELNNFALFILCGLLTLFIYPLIYIYEKMFGLVSDVSLLELSDTNSSLLKELSDKAPGTFCLLYTSPSPRDS